MRLLLPTGLFLLLNAAYGAAQENDLPDLPLNRYQFIGTHNSYHLAPPAKVRQFIEQVAPGEGEALNYSHRPLREQLEKLGIRQIELDIYGDPQGGLYADPLSRRLTGDVNTKPDPAWKEPGFKVFHSPDFDVDSTVVTLRRALRELRGWSEAHPQHEPVFVLLELEEQSYTATKPPVFDGTALLALEQEIRDELPANEILTPDEVRGDAPSLRDAVTQHGWPLLSRTRGRFIFGLDNENHVREEYLALSPQKDLRDRLCFVSVPRDHPAAAWMKRNDPIGGYDEIRSLVQAGFMVRTRADSDLKEVLANDVHRRDAAMSSGAQWISTDAPETGPLWPDYEVAWPERAVARVDVEGGE
jgi:hypothetical protein